MDQQAVLTAMATIAGAVGFWEVVKRVIDGVFGHIGGREERERVKYATAAQRVLEANARADKEMSDKNAVIRYASYLMGLMNRKNIEYKEPKDYDSDLEPYF